MLAAWIGGPNTVIASCTLDNQKVSHKCDTLSLIWTPTRCNNSSHSECHVKKFLNHAYDLC